MDILYSAPGYLSYGYTGSITFAVINTDPRGAGAPPVLNGIFCGVMPAGPPPDHTPPSSTFSSPANGATLSGTALIAFTATDDSGFLSDYRILIDTHPFCASSGCYWDTTQFSNGAHTITAEATDRVGNVGSASLTVTVANQTAPAPPTVSFTSPANGATVSGTIR